METIRASSTSEERLILFKAGRDYFFNGKTDIKCLRCGNPIKHSKNENGYSTFCAKEDCIALSSKAVQVNNPKFRDFHIVKL